MSYNEGTLRRILFIAVLIGIAVVGALLLWHTRTDSTPLVLPAHFSDAYLTATGPVVVQDKLNALAKEGKLTGSGHELLHEVGEYLFQYYGPTGVQYCKPYFDHGCYNGFIIHQPYGTLDASLVECQKIGGMVLDGCIHAAGHAALASTQYDIPRALKVCSSMAQTYGTSTLTACSFGVFMEYVYPHLDPQRAGNTVWLPQKDDLVFPCDSKKVGTQYLPGCWRMQGTIIGNAIDPAHTVALCDKLSDPVLKSYCFDGFSDQYYYAPGVTVQNVFDACSHAGDITSKNTCLIAFVKRSFWYGHFDTMPEEICAQIDPSGKKSCDSQIERDKSLGL